MNNDNEAAAAKPPVVSLNDSTEKGTVAYYTATVPFYSVITADNISSA